jgi:DNA-binding IclR family transcriptional regulator
LQVIFRLQEAVGAMTPKNRSVLRAVSILRVFHHQDEWVSVSEIARRASLPFASTHRLLQTLEETGAVEKSQTGAFRLGYLIASLSQNVDVEACLFTASRDLMAGLSHRLSVSTFMGRLDGSMVTFIGRVLTPHATRKYVTVGSQSPAYSLAMGRVLLANLPEDELDRALHDDELLPLTPHTLTRRTDLLAELGEVRRNGFAVEREQTYMGLGCVAVPLLDEEGRAVAAISASEEVQKLSQGRVELLRRELEQVIPAVRRKILPRQPVVAEEARRLGA